MTRVEQRDQGLEKDDWSDWTVATGLVWTEASWSPGKIRNYGSLDGCYRFGLNRGFLISRQDQELWVSGWLLQVWVEQRLPDLQARSGTVGPWTVATGLVCTEASWSPGKIRNYGSMDGCYGFGLDSSFLIFYNQELWVSERLLRVWFLSSRISFCPKSKLECQRPNFLQLWIGGLKIPNIVGQSKKGRRMMNKFWILLFSIFLSQKFYNINSYIYKWKYPYFT